MKIVKTTSIYTNFFKKKINHAEKISYKNHLKRVQFSSKPSKKYMFKKKSKFPKPSDCSSSSKGEYNLRARRRWEANQLCVHTDASGAKNKTNRYHSEKIKSGIRETSP